MDFIRLHSLQCHGLEARPVSIEVLRMRGLSQISLTGLPDAWLRDSRDKIRALVSSMATWGPLDRILVHLMPADESKNGAHLELPIALGCMAVLEEENLDDLARSRLGRYKFVGSISLEGKLESTLLSDALQQQDPSTTLGPKNFRTLQDLWTFILTGTPEPLKVECESTPSPVENFLVEGRYWERFWMLTAAVAEVPVLLVGPPGAGKSHLARWAYGVLPELGEKRFTVDQIWTLAGLKRAGRVPLLTPHSRTILPEFLGVLRQGVPRPGIFSLAHGGLLILDEFAEMNRDSREILRTILDQKSVVRMSSTTNLTWPANFWLIATSNPCPCGFTKGEGSSRCKCPERARRQYQSHFSGPLLDRMGLKLWVDPESNDNLLPRFIAADILDDFSKCRATVGEMRKKMPEQIPRAIFRIKRENAFSEMSARGRKNKVQMFAALLCLHPELEEELLATLRVLSCLEESLFTGTHRPAISDLIPNPIVLADA